MTESRSGDARAMRVGLLRPRSHCLFSWYEPEGGPRAVKVRPTHCEACIAQLRELGYQLDYEAAEDE
jgi:hypothetical protein